MKIIDIHTHNGEWEHENPEKYDYCGGTMEEFIADLDEDNVEYCIMSSVKALLEDDNLPEGNRATYSDAELDQRLYAATYYNPNFVDISREEIEKYKDHPKFIAFKSRPERHEKAIDDPGYMPLFEAAQELNKPVLLHTWPVRNAYELAHAAEEFPGAAFVMFHICAEDYLEAAHAVQEHENIYLEPAVSTFYRGKIRATLDIVGKERYMFGSDYGLMSRRRIMEYYEEADLTQDEYRAVFRGNALRVFGF